jgi:hypothetical protein
VTYVGSFDTWPGAFGPRVTLPSESNREPWLGHSNDVAPFTMLIRVPSWVHVVESGAPRIADRVALQRGELLIALGQPALACEAFALAAGSPSRDVAVRGNVGKLRCMLEAGDRDGDSALQDLLRRYPLLAL